MANPQINYDDEFLYEHLSLIIQEFEEAALKSGKREGYLICAHSPLQAMDQILESSGKALSTNHTKKASSTQSNTTSTSTQSTNNGLLTITENPPSTTDKIQASVPSVTLNTDAFNEKMHKNIVGGSESLVDLSSIEFDEDLQSLTGTGNVQDYLRECMGCDLRLTFDWQLKPIDLLLPIGNLLADINAAIDSFLNQMNPFSAIENLCDILNGIHWLCIPDLLAILMSLKLLLKSYLTFQLKISLDWTVIIGPLLKIILDAITSLIQAIAGVLVAPLDCVLGALRSVAELEKQLASTLDMGAALASRVKERAGQVGDVLQGEGLDVGDDTENRLDVLFKDVAVVAGSSGSIGTSDKSIIDLTAPTPPSLRTSIRKGETEPEWSEWSFPSGIELTSKVRLPEAIKDKRFNFSHWTTKIILAVQEAKQYILDLVRKIIGSLNSLQGLVSGGLSIQLGNLGLILFIKDMIALVVLIMRLLQEHKGVKDWCELLSNHPEILEGGLSSGKSKINVTKGDKVLILAQGPKVVGTVKTCASSDSGPQQQMINQWINELKRGS